MFRPLIMLTLVLLLITGSLDAQEATEEPIPPAMEMVDEGPFDIVNFLLIGTATENPSNPGLTDSLLVVSVNRTVGTVALVSIPRDLYVYVPGFGMQKINTAYFYGETRGVEGGGIGLLKETVRYNLGLEIDYYARVNFAGFAKIIDTVGGINISVDCSIEDWRLKAPDLDKHDPDNWEMFTLYAGVYNMDSDLALWYVRSRRTSSDIDRGRRQQDVLRALWRKIRADGLLEHLPALWTQVVTTVDTNLMLADVLGMMPLALSIDTADIEYFTFRLKREVNNAYSPQGQQILRPERDALHTLMQQVVMPTTALRIRPERPTLAVVNASGIRGMARIVADRLELEGFRTYVLDEWSRPREYNKIIDSTGATKGSKIGALQKILHTTDEGVEIVPDPNREYDYKIYIGSSYQFLACTRSVIQPPPPTPTPDAQVSS